jgi:hypothetical protein
LKGGANVLIFPDLNSGNIAYKLLSRIGDMQPVGPILNGMRKAVHVLQRGAEAKRDRRHDRHRRRGRGQRRRKHRHKPSPRHVCSRIHKSPRQ